MTLDVIIVSYRSGPLIADCVRSALTFAGDDATVILIDNSPGDGAAEAVAASAGPHTLIENERNEGYAAAVNQGLEAGSSELVLLLNPDVGALRGDFDAVASTFRERPELAALTPRLVGQDGLSQRTCHREPRPFDLLADTLDLATRFPRWQRPNEFRLLDVEVSEPRLVDAATGACLFLRRAAVEDVGPFDESFFVYWEETDWLIRAKRRGWATLYLPDVEAVHLARRSTSVSDETLSLLLLESQHTYSRKHFGRAVASALRAIFVTLDAIRWLRGAVVSRADRRAHMARRLRVHLTGRAPRPVSGPPDPSGLEQISV